jgi:predicted O-methyltransferase YrrM
MDILPAMVGSSIEKYSIMEAFGCVLQGIVSNLLRCGLWGANKKTFTLQRRANMILRMAKRSITSDLIERYVGETITRETAVQRRLRAETALMPHANMQIGADQGALMALLVRLTGTRRALEIGTFTGYSALAVASALPEDGKLIACDVSEEWTSIGRRYWQEAGVASRIDLRIGPALNTLATLLQELGPSSFDFAFIDADKEAYDAYYEACLKLVRSNGLILLDNMIWSGKVPDLSVQDEETRILRALNEKIRDDGRVESCLLTVGDGVMMARKR